MAPFSGPPYNEAWRITVRLLSKILDASVIATSNSQKLLNGASSNYTFVVHRNKYIRYLSYVFRIRKNKNNYDIYFLELIPYSIYFFLFLFILKRKKCIYRLNSYELFDNSRNRLLKNIFLNRVSSSFRSIIVPDEITKKKFCDHLLNIDNVTIIKPGIDLNKFKYKPPSSSSNFRLLMASAPRIRYPWFDDWREAFKNKGIILLLDAIEKINNKYNVELTLIWRDDFYDKILNYINEKNLKNVKVINKQVDMKKYYQNIDSVVLPACSIINTPLYPNSIMESIAIGRPVIITELLNISSIISNSNCGIVIEPKVNQLVNAIKTIIKNYNTLQNNCLLAAKNNFDIVKNAVEYNRIMKG